VQGHATAIFQKLSGFLRKHDRVLGRQAFESLRKFCPQIRRHASRSTCEGQTKLHDRFGNGTFPIAKIGEDASDARSLLQKIRTVFCRSVCDLSSELENPREQVVIVDLRGDGGDKFESLERDRAGQDKLTSADRAGG
jgi:hypothetical protein